MYKNKTTDFEVTTAHQADPGLAVDDSDVTTARHADPGLAVDDDEVGLMSSDVGLTYWGQTAQQTL